MAVNPSRPRALLILGMHRSGTSAVTRVVNLLGAGLGNHILLPGAGNSEGFWEHANAVEINHYLLQALGRSWFDIRQLSQDWLHQAAGRKASEQIKSVIQREFASRPLVAIKDPRMCLTVSVWIEAFEALGYDVQCLFVVRDPREVVASLQARERWPRDPLFLLWAHYMTEALLATGQCQRGLLTYDQLLKDWRGTMQRVSDELSLPWPRSQEAAASDIDAFLHAGHRHHVATKYHIDDKSDADMPSFIAEFYANCLAVTEGRARWDVLENSASTMRNIADLYTPHLDSLLSQHEVVEHKLTAKVQALENLLRTVVSNIQSKS